jgi:hypothetical protein
MLGDPNRHPVKEFALFVLFMAVVTTLGVAALLGVAAFRSAIDDNTPIEISSQSRKAH